MRNFFFGIQLLTEQPEVHIRRRTETAASHQNNLSVRHFVTSLAYHNNNTT